MADISDQNESVAGEVDESSEEKPEANDSKELLSREERFRLQKEKFDKLKMLLTTGRCPSGLSKNEGRTLRNLAKTHQWEPERQELFYVGNKHAFRKKVVLDESEAMEIIDQYHSNSLGEHTGINNTMAKISEHYVWNGMKKDTTDYVHKCACRPLLKKPKLEISASTSQTVSASSYPVLTGERGVNKVTLIGRVGRDPDIRGDEQNPVTIFPLATSQTFRQEDGSYTQFTEWHRIVVFRRALGQMLASNLKKGDKAYVTGSIHYNKIQDKDSTKMTSITQIRADDVMRLSGGASSAMIPDEDSQPLD